MALKILAVDPGTYDSAFVKYECGTQKLLDTAKISNEAMLQYIWDDKECDVIVIEMVASQGKAVGAETFETCYIAGRLEEAFRRRPILKRRLSARLLRRHVKMHLCGSNSVTDSNIRTAVINMYGPTEMEAVGRKACPGPLYNVKADMWQALALAVTWDETRSEYYEKRQAISKEKNKVPPLYKTKVLKR